MTRPNSTLSQPHALETFAPALLTVAAASRANDNGPGAWIFVPYADTFKPGAWRGSFSPDRPPPADFSGGA
jgi:hypothetical protein